MRTRGFRWGWGLSTRSACASGAPDIAQAVNVRVEANEKALLESASKGIEPGFTELSAHLAQLGKTVREEGSATGSLHRPRGCGTGPGFPRGQPERVRL